MIQLNADQKSADKKISDWFFKGCEQAFVLTGYAGTGKTSLIRHTVCETLNLVAGESAVFVTPTGKAATVLIKSGVPACTVHRLIYQAQTVEQEMMIGGKPVKCEKLIFKRRESIDKQIKLIVLDEASMVSDETLADVMHFGVKVLLCGDDAQLPPVEGFNSFLKSPRHTLKDIVRQQEDNPIIKLSLLAREGKFLPYGNFGDKAYVVSGRKIGGAQKERLMLGADQIICGLNSTRTAINSEVRTLKGYESPLPQNGEKLICTYNNWGQYIDSEMKFNLVNGIIGTAIEPFYDRKSQIGFTQFRPDFLSENCPEALPFDYGIFTAGKYLFRHNDYFAKFDENGEAVGAFTLNRFEFGYCISCHKSQGSEFGSVLVFDESYAFREDCARWLYTAVTRARDKLVIIR